MTAAAPPLSPRVAVLTPGTRLAGALVAIGIAEARAAHIDRLAPLAAARAASGPLAILADAGGDPSALRQPLTGLGSAAAPAWLLPVAVAHTDSRRRARITQELGLRSGVTPSQLRACVEFVEAAAATLDGRRPAVNAAGADGGSGPALALAQALWALGQPGPPAETLDTLVTQASFAGLVSAAALLGLRDGLGPIVSTCYRPAEPIWSCLALTPQLIRAHTTSRHDPQGGRQ